MAEPIQLNNEDVAYLLTLLRNSARPMTTQQLIDALRQPPGRAGNDAAPSAGRQG